MTEAQRGRVKFFNKQEGFGFVTDTSGKDYFVHNTVCKAAKVTLEEGDEVAFTKELGKNGGMRVATVKKVQ